LLISWKIWRASKPKRPQALKLLYPVTPSPEALLSLAREQAALDLFSTPRRTRAGTRAWGKTRGTDGGAVAHRQFTLWPRSTGNQAFRTVCRAILRIPSCGISCPRSRANAFGCNSPPGRPGGAHCLRVSPIGTSRESAPIVKTSTFYSTCASPATTAANLSSNWFQPSA